MVVEQRPCVAFALSLGKGRFQSTKEIDPVLVAKEDILAVQPSDYDVVDRPRHIDTFMSRHDFYLSKPEQSSQLNY